MNEMNVKKLAEQLQLIGFPAEVEREIRLYALFHQQAFEVTYVIERGLDQYTAVAFCKSAANGFTSTHYEVSLRRYSRAPTEPVNGVAIDQLEKSMSMIDWSLVYGAKDTVSQGAIYWMEIDRILLELSRLSESDAGAQFASELKLRYWESTRLQKFIGSLAQLKSAIEITQRYFLFEGDTPIVLEEAFRFLHHRWQQKKLNAQVKKNYTAEEQNVKKKGNNQVGKRNKAGSKS